MITLKKDTKYALMVALYLVLIFVLLFFHELSHFLLSF